MHAYSTIVSVYEHASTSTDCNNSRDITKRTALRNSEICGNISCNMAFMVLSVPLILPHIMLQMDFQDIIFAHDDVISKSL